MSGAYAYARFGSIPSLLGSFGIGGLMAMSSMRMKDNMDYGIEGAAGASKLYRTFHEMRANSVASSAMMAIPTAM